MSNINTSEPTTNSFGNTKASTAEIFVQEGGELYISTGSHDSVERLVRSRSIEDGTIVTLLLVPGDLYKLVSHEELDLGSQFKLKGSKVPVAKFIGISEDLQLIPVKDTNVTTFSRIIFNRTLIGEVYNKVIDFLTNNRTWVNIAVTETFSFRNISLGPNSHIGSNMILYIIDFEIVDGQMVVKNSNCVHRKDAIDFLNVGIGENQMLLRQYIKDTTCLQVAFNKERATEYFEILTKTLSSNIKEANVLRKGDRYNIGVNIYGLG